MRLLIRDVDTLTNLASDPASLDVLLRLRAEVDGWMQSQSDRGIAEETLVGSGGTEAPGAEAEGAS